MAKKEQILLENIFDTACVIEESFFGTVKDKFKSGVNKLSQSIHKKASEIGNKVKSKAYNVYDDFATKALVNSVQFNHERSKEENKKLEELKKQQKKLNKEIDQTQKAYNFHKALKMSAIGGLNEHSKDAFKRLNAGKNPTGDSSKTTNTGSGAGTAAALLGLGLGTGVAAKSLYDKAPAIADEAGEHINSLHDKLADAIAAHQEE
jgi:hypothetical protein